MASSISRAPSSRSLARRSKSCRTRGSAAISFARRKKVTPSRSSLTTTPSGDSGSLSPITVCPPEYGWRGNRARPYQDFSGRPGRASDPPAELLLRGLGHHLGGPRRVPDDVHDRLLHTGEGLDLPLDILVEIPRSGASGRREGHPDCDLPVGLAEVDVVHEPQVVDVDRDLGVVALLQHPDDFVLRHHGNRRRTNPTALMNLSLSLLWNGRERLTAREPALQRVVEPHAGLPALPAQEHEPPLDEPVEVDEPLLVVLEDRTERADPLDVLLERALEVVPLADEAKEPLPLRKLGVLDSRAPVFLEVLQELEDFPEPDRGMVHLLEDRLAGVQQGVRLR